MMQCDHARKTGTNTPIYPRHTLSFQPHATTPMSHSSNHGSIDMSNSADPVASRVFLDDARHTNQNAIDAFVLMKVGTPCLRIMDHRSHRRNRRRNTRATATDSQDGGSEVCDLKNPSQVMRAGVRLLECTHPDVERNIGPPLLRALCGLMEELGGLR